jgi:hypothetical protein
MKKMILLMMLVFTVPATAGVVISCDGGTISYDASGIAGNVRAFALDLTCSGGTITDVQCLSTDYDIYPGSIQIDESTGQVTDPGTCVCDASYPGTLPNDGTGVTIEMGSLYESGVESPPADTGDLVQVTYTGTLTVSVNTIRGGIVMENPDQDPDHNLPIECGGGPACLSYDCHGKGDFNGDCSVNYDDVVAMVAAWDNYDPCCDTNDDSAINYDDITNLIDGWNNGCGDCTPIVPQ